MGIFSHCKKLLSAAVCAVMTATMVSFPANAATINEKIKIDGKYRGTTVTDIGENLKEIVLTVESSKAGNFVFGFGIGLKNDPYWAEYTGSGFTETPKDGDSATVELKAGKNEITAG